MKTFLLLVLLFKFNNVARAADLTKAEAIAAAEKFIVENGYTDAPKEKIKPTLDNESLAFPPMSREEQLEARFNSLKPKAIGIRNERKSRKPGWSIAFDYAVFAMESGNCRVVTMDLDGSGMRVEHVEGIRDRFLGFEAK